MPVAIRRFVPEFLLRTTCSWTKLVPMSRGLPPFLILLSIASFADGGVIFDLVTPRFEPGDVIVVPPSWDFLSEEPVDPSQVESAVPDGAAASAAGAPLERTLVSGLSFGSSRVGSVAIGSVSLIDVPSPDSPPIRGPLKPPRK